MRNFPRDLARTVIEQWRSVAAGDIEPPPCPAEEVLRELLEVAYLAVCSPEESRYPQFNLVALPAETMEAQPQLGRILRFDQPRTLSVGELRRLAPAADIERSAIWVEWDHDRWQIAGLLDLGSSWHRARIGLEYQYRNPSCLVLRVERPGRMMVYRGADRVATLSDGDLGFAGAELNTWFQPWIFDGLKAMQVEIGRARHREFEQFKNIALLNVFGSIANSISLGGHGGALVILPTANDLSPSRLSSKYRPQSASLRNAFLDFIRACAPASSEDRQGGLTPAEELRARDAFNELTDASLFVARLAGCDGAIVMSADARLLGFGCELRAGLHEGTQVVELLDENTREERALDVEQFGMRHRSAIHLVSQEPQCCALIVSQDGPISAVWSDTRGAGASSARRIFLRKGVDFVNTNIPWV